MDDKNLDWKQLMEEMLKQAMPLPENYKVTYSVTPIKIRKDEILEFLQELENIRDASIEVELEESDYKEANAVLAHIMNL